MCPTRSLPRSISDSRAPLRAWLRLLACTTLIERRIRTNLRTEFNTTLPRFDVLATLDAAATAGEAFNGLPGLTMSELSERLMVTNGNLTSLVDRLVNDGLVYRNPSPVDRRTQVVHLTPAGRRTLHSMTPAHQTWINDMFDSLSPDECQQLHTLLGKLKHSLQPSVFAEETV